MSTLFGVILPVFDNVPAAAVLLLPPGLAVVVGGCFVASLLLTTGLPVVVDVTAGWTAAGLN